MFATLSNSYTSSFTELEPLLAKKRSQSRSSCDPNGLVYRSVMLLVICVSCFGLFYSLDIPAALEYTIIRVMRVDTTQYELLYSLYSWPSCFFVLIGGVLVDRVFGNRMGLVLFLMLAFIGQALFTLGCYLNIFWLMVVGRSVLSTREMCLLIVDVFAANLFAEKHRSFVYAAVYTVQGLGESADLGFTNKIYNSLDPFISDHHIRLGVVSSIGLALCFISLVSGIIVAVMDYRRERSQDMPIEPTGKFSLRSIGHLSMRFWLFAAIPAFFYPSLFSFISISQVFYEQKFGYSVETANLANGLIYIVPAIAFPFIGVIITWTGYKMSWSFFAILLSLGAHCAYCFSSPTDYFVPFLSIGLSGMAFVVSICSLWTLGFLLVRENQRATAYGIVYCFYDLSQAVATIVLGAIVDNFGYLFAELFFCSMILVGLLCAIILYIVDLSRGKGRLNLSRKMIQEQNDYVST